MQREALKSEPRAAPGKASSDLSQSQRKANNHLAQFIPARDSRNRRVPGLYIRNQRFYCQLWIDRGDGRKSARRFPLFTADNLPVRTLQEAKEALEIKRHDRREDKLPTLGRKPNFGDYSETYLAKAKVQRKRSGTVQNEEQAIRRWRSHLGHVRIDRIATSLIASFVDKRLRGGVFGQRKLDVVGARTVNLDVIVLRNVLSAAIDDGYLRDLPRIKLVKQPPSPKRQLVRPEEFERLLKAARSECEKNGEQLADYLRFLAFSGAREQEALRIKWGDVQTLRRISATAKDRLATVTCSKLVVEPARVILGLRQSSLAIQRQRIC